MILKYEILNWNRLTSYVTFNITAEIKKMNSPRQTIVLTNIHKFGSKKRTCKIIYLL